jgi:ATP-dependent RNA/DNA helicase IGHMBP2
MVFDLVVIDEAAQALETACWGPILQGRRCVLGGDHCQLPPTIKNIQAEQRGLGVTLFERIVKSAVFQENVQLLEVQYRMNMKISDWASRAMYENRLRADETVAGHTLRDIITKKKNKGVEEQGPLKCSDEKSSSKFNNSSNTLVGSSIVTGQSGSINDSINNNINERAIEIEVNGELEEEDIPVLLLIDTSGCDMFEDSLEGEVSRRNFHEADLVQQHVIYLLNQGLSPQDIGVITPYNAQLEVLRSLLLPTEETNVEIKRGNVRSDNQATRREEKEAKMREILSSSRGPTVSLEGVEIKTIDGFQGGEKEVIILSLVRSNIGQNVGFLGDKRRINVGVTRAKRHLAVICDSSTCGQDEFINGLLEHMEVHGEVVSALEYSLWASLGGWTNSREKGSDQRAKKNNENEPLKRGKERYLKDSTMISESDLRKVLEEFKDGRTSGGELIVVENSALSIQVH